jgi:predicted transcriptional regulator
MRYRSRDEIFASILDAAGSGGRMTLTKLMFSCGLSRVQVLEHSRTLIENGLLEYDTLDRIFRTRPSGFRFLTLHTELSEIINFVPNANH